MRTPFQTEKNRGITWERGEDGAYTWTVWLFASGGCGGWWKWEVSGPLGWMQSGSGLGSMSGALEKVIRAIDLKQILDQHAAWLHDPNTGARADLRGADLSEVNLVDACLREANLHGADLRDADLRWADLRGADLRGADLGETDLRGAKLQGADLSDAYFGRTYLIGANLSDAKLDRTKLDGVNIPGTGYGRGLLHDRHDRLIFDLGCGMLEGTILPDGRCLVPSGHPGEFPRPPLPPPVGQLPVHVRRAADVTLIAWFRAGLPEALNMLAFMCWPFIMVFIARCCFSP